MNVQAIHGSEPRRAPRLGRVLANPGVAIALAAIGVVSALLAMRKQGDDAKFPWLYARGFLRGYRIFDATWRDETVTSLTGLLPPQEGMFYPPATGLVLAPWGIFDFEVARVILVLGLAASVLVAVYLVYALARPDSQWTTRLSIGSLMLLAACSRWSFVPVQIAPLFALLLALAVFGLHRSRPWLAFAAVLIAFSLKITLGLPFAILLVLHRRFKMLAASLGGAIAFNAIAFARYGGREAVSAYRSGTSNLEVVGTVNTPDFWELISVPRTDWTYLFTGLSGSHGAARIIALLLSCVVGVYLLRACRMLDSSPSLPDTVVIMLASTCVTLLAVYHHHYDLTIMIVPLLFVVLLHREWDLSWHSWITWGLVPISLIMIAVPSARSGDVLESLFGDRGPGLLKMWFPLGTTLALASSIALIEDACAKARDPSSSRWSLWKRGDVGASVVHQPIAGDPLPPDPA